jgi:structural maintenance of chromosome 3 (chondroitin sulfate proteoglycan 6)
LKNERVLQSTMNKAISTGLQAVRRIRDEHKISGVYGPLIELLETDDVYTTAVEVAAGPQLFNIVVDTDETASKILEIMRQEKAGRVTFVPLNQLVVKNPSANIPTSSNSFPMLDKLHFKPAVKKAFQAVRKLFSCFIFDFLKLFFHVLN